MDMDQKSVPLSQGTTSRLTSSQKESTGRRQGLELLQQMAMAWNRTSCRPPESLLNLHARCCGSESAPDVNKR